MRGRFADFHGWWKLVGFCSVCLGVGWNEFSAKVTCFVYVEEEWLTDFPGHICVRCSGGGGESLHPLLMGRPSRMEPEATGLLNK